MTAYGRHQLFRRVARVFVLLYLIASGLAALHQHSDGAVRLRVSTAARTSARHSAPPSHRTQNASAHIAASDRDCAVCQFIATLLSPSLPPDVAVRPLSIARRAVVPTLRALPYHPYRYADRSASRAPPASA